ncbi:hypothetical protein DYQ86_07690 [Acidobacteria bacterium AB60]|nr:hypothetical protein DYQ86_07690 [Acidobacteria bacterium AB60]
MRRRMRGLGVAMAAITALAGTAPLSGQRGPGSAGPVAETHRLELGERSLQVDFAAGDLDLGTGSVLAHVQKAAQAVVAYYGKFPVEARVLIVPVAGQDGVLQGTTWGGVRGWQGFTRMRIGQHTTQQELDEDWMMTHELVHMAFPTMPDDQHWIEEGLSTYVEPVARVQTGELKAEAIWRDMARDMPKGEPREGDQGIDHTHTWGRTYWGGALFCLVADVAIRRETHNQKGLQDALRAIVERGGTINHDWDLPRALEVGDEATGTQVLMQQYAAWKDKAVTVDLEKLWAELGVKWGKGGSVELVEGAREAGIRRGITEKR